MAFTSTGLILLVEGGFGSAPQLWSYTSVDGSTLVGVNGYFVGMGFGSPHGSPLGMRVGDHVIVAQSTLGATPGQTSFHTVKAATANGSTLGSTWGLDVSLSTSPISTL